MTNTKVQLRVHFLSKFVKILALGCYLQDLTLVHKIPNGRRLATLAGFEKQHKEKRGVTGPKPLTVLRAI